MKLLLVEDDLAIRLMLMHVFALQHWQVEQAADGAAGFDLASRYDYDLILLDIGLPKLDGITVCKQLRSCGCQTPILLLTAQDSPDMQVAGLNAGADDYVTKPFNLDVVLARVRAVARKGKSTAPVVSWNQIQVNSTSGEVSFNGQLIHLTAKEYGLLELFLLNPKRIYSRRAVLDQLWDMADSPGEETVSTHIKCVRQKLKAVGAADPFETVHGLGYRLRAEASAEAPQQRKQAKSRTAAEANTAEGNAAEGNAVDWSVDSVLAQPEALPLADHPSRQKAQQVTSRVWNQFKTQYLEQVERLVICVESLTPNQLSPQQSEAQQLAHKLVGSLGMFGLHAASDQARALEQLMKAGLDAEQMAWAVQRVDALKQTIVQAQDEPLSKDGPKDQPKDQPVSVRPSVQPVVPWSAPILVVDDDLLLAERLRIEAIAWNLPVEIATDLTVARQMIAQVSPSLILLDLSFPGEENGLMLMRELAQQVPRIPVVMFTAAEDLHHRAAAAQLGVSAFLHKPLPAYEILKTITGILDGRGQAKAARQILMVDDDPGFAQALSGLLAEQGIRVTAVTQPQAFWQMLSSCQPDGLILDVEMPEFDGLTLCQVVRTDPKWQHLTVLFLSAHTEPETIAKAYAVGADDYLSKTLAEADLVTRILNRLGRSH